VISLLSWCCGGFRYKLSYEIWRNVLSAGPRLRYEAVRDWKPNYHHIGLDSGGDERQSRPSWYVDETYIGRVVG